MLLEIGERIRDHALQVPMVNRSAREKDGAHLVQRKGGSVAVQAALSLRGVCGLDCLTVFAQPAGLHKAEQRIRGAWDVPSSSIRIRLLMAWIASTQCVSSAPLHENVPSEAAKVRTLPQRSSRCSLHHSTPGVTGAQPCRPQGGRGIGLQARGRGRGRVEALAKQDVLVKVFEFAPHKDGKAAGHQDAACAVA